MRSLSGLDGAFLHLETPETPMHVGSLHLFDLPPGYRGDFHADIKKLMARRLHLAPVFEQRLAPMLLQFANPVWVHDREVDLDWHVQRVTLPAPGGQAELEDVVARLHSEPMDRSRPLWRITIFDGLPRGQAGYYIKVHHAVLDGQAGVLLAQALFDTTVKPRPVPRVRAGPDERPGLAELAAAALKHDVGQYIKFVRHLPEVARTLGGLLAGGGSAKGPAGALGRNFAFGPHTALNVPITGERGFAAVSLPMADLKALAAAHEAKLNDIVLALAAGTLRRWLAHHGGIPKKPLIAAMPISLRAPDNKDYTTQATMALVNLHTHVADPVKRLHAIRDAASAVKALAGRAKGILPTDFPSITLPWLLHGLAVLYGKSGLAGAVPPIANLVVSNVPGPQVPLYAAGARMRSYWPLSIPEHGVGLNLTVMSYAGAVGFGFTVAKNAVPDARALTRALVDSFEELVTRSRPRATPGVPAPRRLAGSGAPASKAAVRVTAKPLRSPAPKAVAKPARRPARVAA
jgi:WS/DGAT/MGAT family acyltransferase